ncbi:MAG: ATP-dependent helicase [Myxococcota bacterium]
MKLLAFASFSRSSNEPIPPSSAAEAPHQGDPPRTAHPSVRTWIAVEFTVEQQAVIEHRPGAHAVVRAAPGAGKTTTLAARVVHLCASGVAPHRIRVLMFNKAAQRTFSARLAERGVGGVRVSTFHALGYEILREAERRGLASKPLQIEVDGAAAWARQVHRQFRDRIASADDIATAVSFWKANLVPPTRAAFPSEPALVEAYAAFEALRRAGPTQRVAFDDLEYLGVAALRRAPDLLPTPEHVLVDEFQDVNPARIALLAGLVGPVSTIMVVGDEDQAINEWCGAHPRFFRSFAETFASLPTVQYRLSQSFRLGPTLAKAATEVVSHDPHRRPGDIVGCGRVPGKIRTVRSVAEAVDDWLDDDPPETLAVLYRTRAQGVLALAALAASGIPVRTDDAALLTRGAGPRLAFAWLRHAADDGLVDLESCWSVVFAPERYVHKEAFAAQLRRAGTRGFRAVLRDAEVAHEAGQSRTAIRSMAHLADVLDRMRDAPSAAEALDLLREEVDIGSQICGRISSERQRDLQIAAFDAVAELLRGLQLSPEAAERAVRALDLTRGAGDRCVHASTIHQAKGLEWPAVVVVGLTEGVFPAERAGVVPGTVDEPHGVEQSDWLDQERRVFYVGLTRASELAYLEVGTPASRFVFEARVFTRRGEKQQRSGKPWTPAQDEVVRDAWMRGAGVAEIGLQLGRSPNAVAARLVRLGLVASRSEARARES